MQHSILHTHYLDYLQSITQNKNLTSIYLTELEVQNLYNIKYSLTEFDIYKYITALDYIQDSLNSNYKLTEGITSNKNKFNNILVDLFYHNISSEIKLNIQSHKYLT